MVDSTINLDPTQVGFAQVDPFQIGCPQLGPLDCEGIRSARPGSEELGTGFHLGRDDGLNGVGTSLIVSNKNMTDVVHRGDT
jgi:hypothetical protein